MKILFVHQSFPAQFLNLAPILAKIPGYQVSALCVKDLPVGDNIEVFRYEPGKPNRNGHPLLRGLERAVVMGEGAYTAAAALCDSGYYPDLIIAHPRWGECLFLKEVWPNSKLVLYLEFYFQARGGCLDFDPEYATGNQSLSKYLKLTNANFDLLFSDFERGISPTEYQRSTFPTHFQNKIDVIHDGVDTTLIKPDKTASLEIHGTEFFYGEEVITYISRSLEPMRGFHTFMRALPEIMRKRPAAKVIIVGMEATSYSPSPIEGGTWKQHFLEKLSGSIDVSRIFFAGKMSFDNVVKLLQLSTVHVHLSYPFTLSWSILEAMSAGCSVVGSNNEPVNQLLTEGVTGKLVDFFNFEQLARTVIHLLENPHERERLGTTARELVVKKYDLRTVCIPKQLEWIRSLCD